MTFTSPLPPPSYQFETNFSVPPLPQRLPVSQVIPNDPYQPKFDFIPQSSLYTIPPKISTFKAGINAVGIDLGTSRCCVTVSKTRAFEIVAIENTGEKLLPSYISYNEEHEKCGQVVVDQLRYASNSTVFDVKRLIGKNFDEVDPDPSWPFKLKNVNGKIGICVETFNGSAIKSPEEISASLLKYIKQKVDEFQGKILSEAVITIPATFTNEQKEATIKAAKLAGWISPILLPEPIAASFAYFNNHEYSENSVILLFDLGGGTLDICLFKVEKNQINIIKECGNDMIGGRDFDRLLIDYFTDRLLNEFKIDVTKDQKKKYKLYSECLKIKHNLSTSFEDR
uniref:Heat shock protein 70 n=1 Tax=Panagrolaimus davidi TaxID=227884 RepID=A0A914QYZ7_9BILA